MNITASFDCFIIVFWPETRPDGPGRSGEFDFRGLQPKRTIPKPFRNRNNDFFVGFAGFGPRNPSGWPRPVRGFRFPAGSGQIDPSRTRSSHFWPFPGSTDHPFGLQIRGPDHWATAPRSRRFPGDRGGTIGGTLGWLPGLV